MSDLTPSSTPAINTHIENRRQWRLRRNCSITPGQLLGVFVCLAVLSLCVAVFFWLMGATLVAPFALVEMLAVAVAFVVFARHVNDGESVSLTGAALVVEQETAGRIKRSEFALPWVRVRALPDSGRLIEVSEGGRSVLIGRFLRPEQRLRLVRELDGALRSASLV